MTSSIDYYYWLNSDWALLGADRLDDLSRRLQIRVNYKPVDLPYVYARTGGVLLSQRSPERQAYRVAELHRWCEKLNFRLNATPKFMCPNADLASCVAIAAQSKGVSLHGLSKAILRAEWCDERDISSEEVLREILNSQGLDAGELLHLAKTELAVATYRSNTEEAIACGVFGSPSYVFEGELFWGQDRLEMLEDSIKSAQAAELAMS